LAAGYFSEMCYFMLVALLLVSTLSHAQSPVSGAVLYRQIMRADSSVFAAFNRCDSVAYKPFFAPDLEFYHDLGGLTTGRQLEIKSFREMCARGTHIRRELVKSTFEVHQLGGYGAVEIGVHRFYHTNKGQTEKPSGTYKFIHVWQRTPTGWRITRVISYGHEEMKNE
jgi:ketosteroid isomerase-like protein